MKFGINLFPTVGPADQTPVDYYDHALALGVYAEELGYHHVKTVEHYFFDYGGYSPDPTTFLAALAARTERIRLITGAVVPAFDHPIKLAARLAMLDNLSHGRLDVGVARGFLPEEFAAFGVSLDESRPRFDATVEAIRALWTGEEVTVDNGFHTFGPVTLQPRPYQRPHPQILVATAITPESAERAGAAGYGLLLVPSINPREKVQDIIGRYRAAREAAGFDPGTGEVHLSYSSFLADDPDTARELGERFAAKNHRALAQAVAGWSTARSEQYTGYDKIVGRVASSDFASQLAADKTIVGTPAEVIDQIARIRDAFGEVTLSLQAPPSTAPDDVVRRSLQLFAEEVLPKFSAPLHQ
ncbi:LLM class flavin-dependent oxidoreductase [Nocardia sp. AG03]|uniref:LLM class flavin-dependent oxidoreductase n=1 Tax=Nocardia sp. AG03 TaxID=3025312 RepID=UPI002418933F|nr:LLM class flavin-dependent oxidoreductase [Nocardia sp. AG03]